MGFFDKIFTKTADKVVKNKVNDITNGLWGNKAKEYGNLKSGDKGVKFEDGSVLSQDEFVAKELMRIRNRDVNTQRVLLGLGAFYITGQTYKFVEKTIKGER